MGTVETSNTNGKANMNTTTFAADLAEMMSKWNTTRAAWIKTFGSDAGFAEWFSKQVGL
jgi:hypothetical protein